MSGRGAPGAVGDRRLAPYAGLLALGALAFGPHVARGGRWADDWVAAARYAFDRHDSWLDAVSGYVSVGPARPLAGLYLGLSHGLLGTGAHGHLALAALWSVAMAVAACAVLRALGLPGRHAFAIAALILLFPAADSTGLWPSAAPADIAITLYLLGTLAALRGLAAPRALRWHVVALACYAASLLVYEIALGPILLSGAVYAVRAPWREVWPRWTADVALTLLVVATVKSQEGVSRLPIGPEWLEHAARIAGGALLVASWAVVPLGRTDELGPARVAGGLTLVAILAGAVMAVRRRHPAAAGLRPWLVVLAGGAAVAAVSYATLVPARGYLPTGQGIANRVNGLAAVGVVATTYAATRIAGWLLAGGNRRRGAAVAGVLTAALGAGYALRLSEDVRAWDRARRAQAALLGGLERALPRIPSQTSIYAYGTPTFVQEGVPVFLDAYDLGSALALERGAPGQDAFLLGPGVSFDCGAERMRPIGGDDAYRPTTAATYGRVIAFDAERGRARAVRDAAGCRALVQALER